MKTYTREQLLKRLKISIVLGVILALITVVATVGLAIVAGEGTVIDVIFGAGMGVFCALIFTLNFFGLSFNFRKFLLGYIAPIPILSAVIENLKAYIYAVKGIMVIIKHEDCLTIGSSNHSDEDDN